MRAYLRMDPELSDKKSAYPDGAFRAFVSTLCAAEQQPHRGRFKTAGILRAYLGKHAKWIKFLREKKDLVELEKGVLYVDGWDEWQEGDWKVKERVDRIRKRQKVTVDVTVPVTPDVTVGVTPNETPLRMANSGKPLADSGKASTVTVPTVTSSPADAIGNGQTDDPVLKLGVGMHDLLGHALSGQDAIACQAALNQYAYMDAEALLQRAREHIEHCQSQVPPLPTPRTVAGFSDTWRLQNDWLADHGAPKAWRQRQREAGLTAVGDVLGRLAAQKDPDE